MNYFSKIYLLYITLPPRDQCQVPIIRIVLKTLHQTLENCDVSSPGIDKPDINDARLVVNFVALAQASDFRIERRQVVFLCWRQDSNPEGLRHIFASRLYACWQTDWAIEDQAKIWTRQPVPMISKHSAHLTPLPFGIRTWLWRYTYLLLLISMLWHRQAIFESKGDKLSSSAEGMTNIHTYIHI